MKTLNRQFIVATLCILVVSILIAFGLANFVYMTVTKKENDLQNTAIATEIVDVLEHMHSSPDGFEAYLKSIGKLGYQMYVLGADGQEYYFGEPFKDTALPAAARRVITHQDIYHGMNDFPKQTFMMGHFANELKNTVGVPFQFNGESYGLFLRPDRRLLFSDVHTVLAGFVMAIALVSIIGMVWLARQLLKPIVELTKATQEITKENFSYPLHIDRQDEIGQLAQSFNRMQKQLQHNDTARKAFISDVSHDFQSPLMNIQGYAEVLKSPDLNDQERLEYLNIIDQESRRLSNLTKQLLLLTSLDQASYPVKYGEVSLDRQLKMTLKRYRWRLEEQDIELTYKMEPVAIKGDSELLANVWDNLLTNAIKYNRHRGSIYIELAQDGDKARVMFKDTGVGIPEEAAEEVFERFFRVDESRKMDGAGLGLSIVQQIVNLHQGSVTVQSEAGRGSVFTVTLPLK
ncbi:sensor histidine kinase [Paenibacillus lemnae]|uniref:Heme sensor protein HssS n=1 Tax=Paenibacillus lemnae TaxID=1330551 RepID=A0A848M1K2_PAELE|nr:HAMP domain-containing sensor histidine kinase [Paenibacillus lemnae]NMO94635.1 HAMP domain-containing histidine kinase [Paenibacillus lemnae]